MNKTDLRGRATVVALLLAATLSGCAGVLLGNGQSERASAPKAATETSASDRALIRQVRMALAADAMLSEYAIFVAAADGNVSLSGTVGSFPARDQAIAIARSVVGVKAVDNRLRVDTRQ